MRSTRLLLVTCCTTALWLTCSQSALAQSQYNDPEMRQALRQQQVESRLNRNSRFDSTRFAPTEPKPELQQLINEQELIQITSDNALLICEQQERYKADYVSDNQQERLIVRLEKRTGLEPELITHLLETTVQCARILDMFGDNNQGASVSAKTSESVSTTDDETSSNVHSEMTGKVSNQQAWPAEQQSTAPVMASSIAVSSRSEVYGNDASASDTTSSMVTASDNTSSAENEQMATAESEAAYEKLAALCRIQARLDDEYNMEPAAVQTTAQQLSQQWSIDTEVLVTILNEPELCTNPNPLWLRSPMQPESNSASAPTAIGIIILLTLFGVIGAYTLRRFQRTQ